MKAFFSSRGAAVLLSLTLACSTETRSAPAPLSAVQSASRIHVPSGVFLREGRAVHIEAFFLDRAPRTVAEVADAVDLDALHEATDFDLQRARFVVREEVSVRLPHGLLGTPARENDPATQLSALDAERICAREGGRLPTEDEWEHAARNGRGTVWRYPWGDDAEREGRSLANTWDGVFPTANTLRDGHLFASPVGAFPATPLGFVDLVGNVWQWTSTAGSNAAAERVIRGGSYLCDPDVCHGFRVDARQLADPHAHFAHIGFRCAFAE